jgi:hypothetical protein
MRMKTVDELRAELLAEPWGKLAQEAGFDPVDTESSARRAFEFCAAKMAAPVVSISPMRLSDGRTDFYVEIRVGDRIVHPHVFRDDGEYKAAYHVALYDWLLNGKEKPDLMEFKDGDFPAQAYSVVHRDDDRVKNALKHLITSEKVLIEPKGWTGCGQVGTRNHASLPFFLTTKHTQTETTPMATITKDGIWLKDERGNKASTEYFGDEVAARRALESLKNCDDCVNCSRCSDCSRCSNCTECSYCLGCSNCSDCTGCLGCSHVAYLYSKQSKVGDPEAAPTSQRLL